MPTLQRDAVASSMAYRIFETRRFLSDLQALDPPVRARLEEKLRGHVYPYLSLSPRYAPNVKRLRDYEPPTWRYRIGDWRFFYTVDDEGKVVSMLVAEHRARAYGRRSAGKRGRLRKSRT